MLMSCIYYVAFSPKLKAEIYADNPKGGSCRLKMTFSNREDRSLRTARNTRTSHAIKKINSGDTASGDYSCLLSLCYYIWLVLFALWRRKKKRKVYIWYDCFACLRFKSSTESFLKAEGSVIYTKSHKPFTAHFEQNGHQCYLPFENTLSYFIYIRSSLCF